MTLDDFRLEKAVLEVRYTFAYLHWDRAGQFWSTLAKNYPDMKSVKGEPGQTVFNLGRDFQVNVQLERAAVLADEPSTETLKAHGRLCDELIAALTGNFEVAVFSRVGFRLTYFREFASPADAAAAVIGSGLIKAPKGRHFGAPETLTSGAFTERFEDNDVGAVVRLESEARKIDFEPGFGVKELEPVHQIKHGVTLDVDMYTRKPVSIGKFRASDWIAQKLHEVRRDAGHFLGA